MFISILLVILRAKNQCKFLLCGDIVNGALWIEENHRPK